MNKKETTAVICIALFVAFLPLFTLNCITGHDSIYHLLRIESLKTGIESGLPFLRINMLFFGGQGYASSLFYPDLFLYIPALLRVLGVGINASWHIYIAFCLAAGFAAAYYCMYTINRDRATALMFAVIFTLFRYHLFDIYVRGAAGEFTAMIFVPFVLAGLYDMLFSDFAKPQLLIIGMAGVILTHTITTAMCLILCIVVFITGIKNINAGKIKKLLLSILSVVLLTAFYVFPMLEMLLSTDFSLSGIVFDLGNEKLLLKDVFSFSGPGMGVVLFIPLLLRIFIKKEKDDRMMRFADICMITALAACLFTTGFFPWKRFEAYLYQIQFPWRLFVLAGPLAAFSGAVYLKAAVEEKIIKEKTAVFAVLSVMILSAVYCFEKSEPEYYSYSDDYFDYPSYTAEVIGGEWLPASVQDRDLLIKEADMAFDDIGNTLSVTRYKNSLKVEGIDPSAAFVDVPFVYYKGYTASDAEGRKLVSDGSGHNGQVRVHTNGSGSVTVRYAGTPVQLLFTILSLLAVIAAAVIFIMKKKGKKS
ncbi:MAG: hypothetical protein J5829_01310 [Lachnospiraceae bacterium]|nr:hypothetical protein [Lachnospiraceae bacterium]